MSNEMPSCFKETLRIARKNHECCECFGKILKGEKYLVLSGVWGGRPASYKRCADCQELAERINVLLREMRIPYDEYVSMEGLSEELDGGEWSKEMLEFIEICKKRNSKSKFSEEYIENLKEKAKNV